MSTLENLRFQVEGSAIVDTLTNQVASVFEPKTALFCAKLLNEKPAFAKRFSWLPRKGAAK